MNFNKSAWQFACDKSNLAAESAHNSAQASKPENERAAFEPQVWQQYAQARIEEIEASYLSQEQAEFDLLITSSTPEDKARIAKILSASEQAKEAIRAQVDRL